jgi:hypothetical protein
MGPEYDTPLQQAENNAEELCPAALRFTLAGCMFAIPENHISISSPCQVSCAPLNESVGYQVTNDSSTTLPTNAFCTASEFDDATINRCATCYSFIPQQLFQANCKLKYPFFLKFPVFRFLPSIFSDKSSSHIATKVLQALHIFCRDPPATGKPFFPDANAIFNETLIAGPAPPGTNNSGGSGLHGWQLALAIALPIVGGILIIGAFCWCCFAFTRKRRYKMAQSGRMSRIHDAYADSTYQSPASAKAESWNREHLPWGIVEPPREMHAISPTANSAAAKQHSPGFAQGRWSHTPGGQGSEANTPLRNSFQRDDVGPGPAQLKDPNLHEQYFGVGDEMEDEIPGPSSIGVAHGHYPDELQDGLGHGHGQLRGPEDERGHFI